ncbi:hypothetical protein FACS1894182_02380 [Bacteroidia bacterium]|nr:hypothetical protein FACS1894182_02380 [Bacteroidia bacterium]
MKRLVNRILYKQSVSAKELQEKKNRIQRKIKTEERENKKFENEHKHALLNEEALLEINLAYSLEQYNELLTYFQNKGVSQELIEMLKKFIDEMHKKKNGGE